MPDKFEVVSPSGSFRSAKEVAAPAARVAGTPVVKNGVFTLPFDSVASGKDVALIHSAAQVMATASAANTDIASVNIALYDPLFWDAGNSKITNVAAGNRRIGRALEAKDFSGGVAVGATLLFELDPSSGYRVHCGIGTLDGSNPTPITHGLTTCLAFVATLIGNTAPGDNTSVLTAEISTTVVNVYAWKNTGGSDPTLVASTGTETFMWVAVGL